MRLRQVPPAISVLPADILFMIFEILVIDHRCSSVMIPVSHVCQLWRQIAIQSPCLWTYVQYTFDDLAEHFTPRSKQAPLYLNIGFDSEGAELDYLARHIIRTRELEVGIVGRRGYERLQKVLQAPQDVIEVLKLRRWGPCASALEFSDLFGDNAPRLRELELTHVTTCSLPAFTGLTRLAIRGNSMGRMDLMSALRKMSHLQTLELQITGLPDCNYDYSGERQDSLVARLPSLQSLRLSGKLRECAYFMAHTESPPLTNLIINTTYNNDTPIIHLQLFQFLRYHPRPGTTGKLRLSFGSSVRNINCDHQANFRTDRLEWSMVIPETENLPYIASALVGFVDSGDYNEVFVDLKEGRKLESLRDMVGSRLPLRNMQEIDH